MAATLMAAQTQEGRHLPTRQDSNATSEELHEVRTALADAERQLRHARMLHAMHRGPPPHGLEEDVAVLRAEEHRLQNQPS